ncbi:FkbM family methyltransferase [Ruegeria sp. SCSIO 43209]|uniref:FkbM family methyltransferase n=1 Tax=Ruegeria sp. SCSIO 43209 TaxID=2793010 RepID=UPI001CA8C856|nr:FkbM family methyltransferase [Ruegeria sp. SCSIO 43209]UAB88828.1 FkbM family methyltransferase [Ruegeria sp. SCSIO 43209]
MSDADSQIPVTNAQMEYANACLREAYNLTGRGRVRNLIRKSLLPQLIAYRGIRIHLHPYDNFSEFSLWQKGRSPEELELNWLKESFAGKTLKVLDIGANFGLYSLFLSSILSPNSRIHAFEPNPTLAERLSNNCSLNGFGNVELNTFAIAGETGEATLIIEKRGDTATNLGQARLANDPAYLELSKYDTIEVQTRTLLELTHLHDADFAKLDVEGHEPNILMPFLESAEDAALPQYLQLETVNLGDSADRLFASLSDRGYENAFQTQRNIIFRR